MRIKMIKAMKNKNMQSNKVWSSAVQLILLSFVLLLSQLTLAKDRIQYHVQNFDGSTLKVINEQGVVSQSYQYAPFGQQLQYKKPSNLKNPNAFVGGVQDADDLVYLKQRHYNPVLGRFYQPDQITFLSGSLGQINRYQYGWNDTYTFSDPNGLNPDEYYKALDKDLQAYFRGQITFEAYSQNAQMYGLLIRKDSEPSLFSTENIFTMVSVMLSRGTNPIAYAGSGIAGKQGQLTPNACGMACGQKVLSERGIEVFQSNLAKGFYKGLSPEQLAKNINSYQSGWKGVQALPEVRDIQGLYSSYGSYIAMLGHSQRHFVTVQSVSGGIVRYWDPAGGVVKTMPIKQFATNTTGLVWKDK